MTCREFKHTAASLTLWELTRSQDREITGHAEACPSCGTWLQKQRSLAASMRTLQTKTAGLEAGPSVEQALLRAFRQAPRAEAVIRPAGVKERFGPRPVAALRSTPVAISAIKLSRLFEIGAYAAVAAAIVIGVFLGARLMRDRQATGPAPTQTASAGAAPVTHQPAVVGGETSAVEAGTHSSSSSPARHASGNVRRTTVNSGEKGDAATAADSSQTSSDAEYMALMICDPLSCSTDSQVVRMELPAASGQDAAPQVADVVVGYDGVVRAVRIVN